MATSTATLETPFAMGPIRGSMPNEHRVLINFNAGTYATGGVALTEPTDVKGLDLKGVSILNPHDSANDRIYSWNGSQGTPLIDAHVVSTGAEVANSTDLSGYTIYAELIYAG